MTTRVLVVDSETDVAGALASRLARLGYVVEGIADSCAQATVLAAARAPDLAIVGADLRSETAGLPAVTALRRRWSLPVVRLRAADAGVPTDGRDDVLDVEGPDLVTPCSDRELRMTLELARCRHESARAMHDLEGFFAVSRDMFCFLGFDGHFRRLNPAWERTLGFTPEEMMSRRFIEFVHPDDRERTLDQNRDVRGGGEARGFENRYVCKDGSYRWLLWNSAPSTADQVIYAVARDITARKAAEDERARLIGELQASLAEVRTLQEILPICSYCRRIRDDENYWQSVESYIAQHTHVRFSHGICPHCMATEVEPQLAELDRE